MKVVLSAPLKYLKFRLKKRLAIVFLASFTSSLIAFAQARLFSAAIEFGFLVLIAGFLLILMDELPISHKYSIKVHWDR